MSDGYSEQASRQLDELEANADPKLWNAIAQAIELIFDHPRIARQHSTAFHGNVGIALCLPVVGFEPYKVFWTSEGPSIEAVFPHP